LAHIVILGAGVMGSAMAFPAADQGHKVTLIGTHLDEAIIESILGNGHHPRLDVAMPEGIEAHHLKDFTPGRVTGADLIIFGLASVAIDWAIEQAVGVIKRPIPILMITKGLATDGESIEALPIKVARELKKRLGFEVPVMAVGGPCIAGELAARRDTGVVITGVGEAPVSETIAMLGAGYYHARPDPDVVGVEICAAFKNFFAIGVGTASGRLEREGKAANNALMYNLSASLFNQSVRELAVLVEALGGDPATSYGMPGVGDLYVTCQAGRNSRMGRWLGLGLTYKQAKAQHMAIDTVEGAELGIAVGPALRGMMADGRLSAERLPLTAAILDVLLDEKPFSARWDAFHRRAS
jgi:glycerol-3-phosphate dehydrogenase (NAD(P)+)